MKNSSNIGYQTDRKQAFVLVNGFTYESHVQANIFELEPQVGDYLLNPFGMESSMNEIDACLFKVTARISNLRAGVTYLYGFPQTENPFGVNNKFFKQILGIDGVKNKPVEDAHIEKQP